MDIASASVFWVPLEERNMRIFLISSVIWELWDGVVFLASLWVLVSEELSDIFLFYYIQLGSNSAMGSSVWWIPSLSFSVLELLFSQYKFCH